MEIFKVDAKRPTARALDSAVKHLGAGGLVVYPTETAYALGADATNAAAVRTIFQVKARTASKALPLIVASTAMARRTATFPPLAARLARAHWPGPLTLVLPVKRSGRLAFGAAASGTVALRVSSHPIARMLCENLGRPIISTSANRSGHGACYSIRGVKREFKKISTPIMVLDAGTLARRRPSTIVRVAPHPVVLRVGSIKILL